MKNIFIVWASVYGALAVSIGAFGAHAYKSYLQEIGRLDVFETAVKYQFYHTLAMLLVGLLLMFQKSSLLNWSGYCFGAGILVFSGSLYLLCITNIAKWGAITPIGGLLFIAGWVLMIIYGLSNA